MSASLIEVYVGLERWLSQSADLLELLEGDNIYPWRVPENKPLNYITFPTLEKGPLKLVFNKRLSEGSIHLSIWSAGMLVAGRIADIVLDRLEETVIPVAGGVSISGTARIINIAQDPNDDTLYQGIIRYEWQSWTT